MWELNLRVGYTYYRFILLFKIDNEIKRIGKWYDQI